ncbi:type I polyketide synthase [Paludibacterium paludis]|uniref:Polyketide-type polyunsaturated fatty acid synthase PfaA n=1 Tax=Paludibacterium paludis TaxID=1225769 RepID=A0A918P1Y6_9NEIS|nr:type I polyketide synthase [Paludibacterium paludis]GGY14852.1 hypothetical protein GCM10011289_17740 [Paludibacterium paludis]
MSKAQQREAEKRTSDIAIVGMASHFPDAPTLYDFWTNVVNKKDSIVDIDTVNGDEYWRKNDFYDPDTSARDKTYGFKAGFVPPIGFDPVEFKLPPLMLESISTAQLFALYVAKQAMRDARLIGDDPLPHDRDRVGVILGGAGNGNTSFSLASRQQAPYLKKVMIRAGLSEEVADEVIDRVNHLYLEWNEDAFPGFLGNVACGRIASYFDLGGTSYMVDAACASSLAAIKAAIGELTDGSCDIVLTGGVNLENSVFSFLCFSKTPALSKSNLSRPFDKASDGMMLGDGVGFLVLKRLEDAERDGDRVYAVIKSLQAASDGRAKSVFAPRLEGQVKAMKRAYERAGVTPVDIQLVEAHGTGTQSGDDTEIRSLRTVYEAHGVPEGSVAVGSIKSQIGHTRCAAGAASMMKVALGLYHKVLPPTLNIRQPSEELVYAGSPFYVNVDSRPWLRKVTGQPRRAAVSAFGFGGTNYHAILEEHQPEPQGDFRLNRRPEVVVFHAPSPDALLDACETKLFAFGAEDGPAAFRRYQSDTASAVIPATDARLAFVAGSADDAVRLLGEAARQLHARRDSDWEHPQGIYYKVRAAETDGRIVALFPGQGSQYVNMGRDLANDYPVMRQAFEALDAVAHETGAPLISDAVFPAPAFTDEASQAQMQALTQTRVAQPAIGAVSAGYFRLLGQMGLKPDFMAGHSYGEVTALWAAGVMSDRDYCAVSLARGAAADSPAAGAGEDPGAMLAVSLNETDAGDLLSRFKDVIIANYNSPEQLVLGGATASIREVREHLESRKVRCQILPVAAAFHTPSVRHACAPFKAALAGIAFHSPASAVYSTATGERHSQNPDAIKDALVSQLISPVYFKQTIERIHDDGGRIFIEIGPKGTLGKLVANILQGKPHSVISLNPGANGEEALQFKRAVAKLLVEGVHLTPRDPRAAPLPAVEQGKKAMTYTMSGGFFLSDRARQRREHAFREDFRVVEAFIESRSATTQPTADPASVTVPPQQADEMAVQVQDSENNVGMGWDSPVHAPHGDEMMQRGNQENEVLSLLDSQIHAQNVLSQVHQQFQLNQKDYIQLLDSLITKQFTLLDKFGNSNQLPQVVDSLNRSLQLLDKNQELYHVNHEHYFDNQQAMMGRDNLGAGSVANRLAQRAPVQIAHAQPAPAVSLPNLNLAAPQPAPASTPSFAAVQPPKPSLPSIEAAAPAAPVIAAPAAESGPVLSAEDLALVKRFEAVTEASLVKQLIDIVSDRTGYPADMITEEMDLEADLGIDSIKRLEIFGAMFDALSADVPYFHDSEKHKDMETFDIDAFSNIRKMAAFFMSTIAELLAALKGGVEHDAAPALADAAIEAATPVPPAPTASTAAPIHETPDTEAPPIRNLGFVATTRALGHDDVRTEEREAKKSQAESREDASAPVRRLIASDAYTPSAEIHRYRAIVQVLPAPDQREIALPQGRIWLLTDDGKGLSDELAKRLGQRGQSAVRLVLGWTQGKGKRKPVDGVADYVLERADEAAIAAVLENIAKKEGEIGGFLHLGAPHGQVKGHEGVFAAADYDTAEALFLLAKALQPTLAGGYFFTVSQIDGALGTAQRSPFPVVASGMTGLAKSLNIEWEDVFCRSLDIDPKASRTAAAEMILEELGDPQTDLAEVGRGAQGERIGLDIALAPVEGRSALEDIDASSVFLATGGARGITAQCLIELAKRYPARFALLGRTPIDGPLPDWASQPDDPAALKAGAIKALQAAGEQPTPVKVDRMLKEVLHISEVRQTLRRIEEAGGQAIYLNVDITDAADVKRAVAETEKRLGKITGLIHGAGNLADKRIEKKTPADFRSVFHTKVKGLENLLAAVRPGAVKHLVLFSSVSGFFGNAGQTDYAMANDTLNKFAYLFAAQHPGSFVRSINWGPWDTGMVNDVLKKAYAERNLAIIPSRTGVEAFVREFTTGSDTQILIGGGRYKVGRKVKALPALTRIVRELLPERNPFLQDHVVHGHAVLPATLAAGWMVRLGEDLLPGYHLECVSDLRVLKGIVFDEHEASTFFADLTPVSAPDKSGDRHVLDVTIFSEAHGERVNRYHGRVTMSREKRERPVLDNVDLVPDAGAAQIYGDMARGALLFHGPAFRGIDTLIRAGEETLVAGAVLAPVTPAAQGQFPVGSFNPYLADVFVQPPLAWLMLKSDKAGLPSKIDRIELFAPLGFAERFYLSMQVVAHHSTMLVADIAVHDEDGRLFARLTGLEFTASTKIRQKLCDPESAVMH